MTENKTFFIIASGSGGHIIPALVYTKKIAHQNDALFYLTGNKTLEKKIVPDYKHVIRFPSIQLPGKKIWKLPLFFLQLIYIFFKSAWLFFKTPGKKEIVTTGSILSIPIGLAAWCSRIPLTLIELNATCGKTTRFLSPFAHKIATVFNLKKSDSRYHIIPYPLRSFHITAHKNPKKFTIALFGGSQGSQELNRFFLSWLTMNKNRFENLKVYHFYGHDESTDFPTWYQTHNIEAITAPWCDKPENVYAVADLVFSRAGSGALHELAYFQIKSIIVPLRTVAEDHQYKNALAMQKTHPHLFFIIPQVSHSNSSSYNCISLNSFIGSCKPQELKNILPSSPARKHG